MSPKRRWSQWPSRVADALNGVSGVAGVGGIATSLASWSFLAGNAALALTGVGALTTASALGVAIYKSIPPKLKRPEELVGKTVRIAQLNDVFPRLPSIAIVGATQAGKTTLRQRLAFQIPSGRRTQDVTAFISALPSAPHLYVAILDGGGESYPQQFAIAEFCDAMCIVIDHNLSHTSTEVDQQRLAQHQAFLEQIRKQLDESNAASQKEWIHLLVNKHDLWKNALGDQKGAFETFCRQEMEKWKDARFGQKLDLGYHSNAVADDVSQFVGLLTNWVQTRYASATS